MSSNTSPERRELDRTLRTRIVSGQLLPGAFLDVKALAEEFGVQTMTVRRGLDTLALDGLVTRRRIGRQTRLVVAGNPPTPHRDADRQSLRMGVADKREIDQAREMIHALLERGRVGQGKRILSTQRLVDDLDISRASARGAIDSLMDEGHLRYDARTGYLPNTAPQTPTDRSNGADLP